MFCWYNWGVFNYFFWVNMGFDKCYFVKWLIFCDYVLSNLDCDNRFWVLRDVLFCFYEYLVLCVFLEILKEFWKILIKLFLLIFYIFMYRYCGGCWRMWCNRWWFILFGKSCFKICYYRMWRWVVYKCCKLVVFIGRRYRKVWICCGWLIIRFICRIIRWRKGYIRRGKWLRLGCKGFVKCVRFLWCLRCFRRLRKRRRRW